MVYIFIFFLFVLTSSFTIREFILMQKGLVIFSVDQDEKNISEFDLSREIRDVIKIATRGQLSTEDLGLFLNRLKHFQAPTQKVIYFLEKLEDTYYKADPGGKKFQDILLKKGDHFYDAEIYDRAIENYSHYDKYQSDSRVHFRIGYISEMSQNYQTAIKYYQKSYKGLESQMTAKRLGLCYNKTRDYSSSIRYLDIAYRSDRKDYEVLQKLGDSFEGDGRVKDAIKCFQILETVEEHKKEAVLSLIKLYQKDGNERLLIAKCLDVLDLDIAEPDQLRINYILLKYYEKQGNMVNVMKHMRNIMDIDPNYEGVAELADLYEIWVKGGDVLAEFVEAPESFFLKICSLYCAYSGYEEIELIEKRTTYWDFRCYDKRSGGAAVLFVFVRMGNRIGERLIENYLEIAKRERFEKVVFTGNLIVSTSVFSKFEHRSVHFDDSDQFIYRLREVLESLYRDEWTKI